MDMKQMVAGVQGQGMEADQGHDVKMMEMMTQMRSMLDEMIGMMGGGEAKQAGFESVDKY